MTSAARAARGALVALHMRALGTRRHTCLTAMTHSNMKLNANHPLDICFNDDMVFADGVKNGDSVSELRSVRSIFQLMPHDKVFVFPLF